VKDVEKLAKVAYTTFSTEVFGAAPGRLAKRPYDENGLPQQERGVVWEQLPPPNKERWRKVVTAILTEAKS